MLGHMGNILLGENMFWGKFISVECFSTPTACRAYNVTISSHRKAGALLMPI